MFGLIFKLSFVYASRLLEYLPANSLDVLLHSVFVSADLSKQARLLVRLANPLQIEVDPLEAAICNIFESDWSQFFPHCQGSFTKPLRWRLHQVNKSFREFLTEFVLDKLVPKGMPFYSPEAQFPRE